jgi:Tol biopolymer transport system component
LPLTPGSRIGSFEVVSPLGAGGMGEVYRARDTRLDRPVAIKILLDSFADDADRLARFEREARLLASLNHPHIAQIYGLEESGTTRALVMELVDGPTLADRIAQGPMPLDEALAVARQIADALEAAHAQGIVHRDLKPANVKLRPDGTVKVLDFGLAKLADAGAATGSTAPGMSLLPTVASPVVTQAGIILGTVAYMSPEQARGKPVDERTDIWAFGCVLYEMLTGRRPFQSGDTTSDEIAAILTREPVWTAVPANTPESVQRLLRRCLQKDGTRRLRDAGDAKLELDDASAEPVAMPIARESRTPHAALAWGVAAVAGLVAMGAGGLAWSRASAGAPPPAQTTRLEFTLPPGVELFGSTSRTVASSPDGRSLAFVGTAAGERQLFLRRLDRFEVTPIRGTEGATTSFFSPDGKAIGFATSAGELRTASLTDGLVTTTVRGASILYGAVWTGDDHIVYVHDGALWQVPRSGGEQKALTTLANDEITHAYPTSMADKQTLLFAVQSKGGQWRIDAVNRDSGARQSVLTNAMMPLVGPGNRLFFYRDGQLLVSEFDPATMRISGAPQQVLESVPSRSEAEPAADVSTSGMIVYAPGAAARRLVWVSRAGVEAPVVAETRGFLNPRLSPDGSQIVVQAGGIWILDLRRQAFQLLPTQYTATNAFPTWLPDGKHVVHRSGVGLRVESTGGIEAGRTLEGTTEFDYPGAVTPGNQTLVLLRNSPTTSFDLLLAPFANPTEAKPFAQTPAYEGGGRLSSDGKWLVYVSNESGRNQVYVRSFPDGDRRLQVSTDGGTQPAVSANGREIFYRNGDRMMAVESKTTAAGIELGQPKLLFERPYSYGAGITISNYDVTADGERFLMVKDEDNVGRLRVVLNWRPDAAR